jgi:hypothetical protein
MNRPGRFCPADYRYDAASLARDADFRAETLYVLGGLYGNLAALVAIERLAAAEAPPVRIVFNGDFHWFDAAAERFAYIDHRVQANCALRGNVETEPSRSDDIGAGCGCAYPTWSNKVLWSGRTGSCGACGDAWMCCRGRESPWLRCP